MSTQALEIIDRMIEELWWFANNDYLSGKSYALKEARQEIAKLPDMGNPITAQGSYGWVSVEDRLPEEWKEILAFNNITNSMQVARRFWETYDYCSWEYSMKAHYWKHLPPKI